MYKVCITFQWCPLWYIRKVLRDKKVVDEVANWPNSAAPTFDLQVKRSKQRKKVYHSKKKKQRKKRNIFFLRLLFREKGQEQKGRKVSTGPWHFAPKIDGGKSSIFFKKRLQKSRREWRRTTRTRCASSAAKAARTATSWRPASSATKPTSARRRSTSERCRLTGLQVSISSKFC